ncbi:MAG TPA: serine hydrolase [Gemmatimonadaceae bacterium]|nr:serine hydrolase [Gemmatimonadaceae bacterium]
MKRRDRALVSNAFCAAILLIAFPVGAQGGDVPRTRTLPGIESPAFPYVRPEEVGLSSEKLERLGAEVASWVAAGDLVGGELLIVKNGRTVFHEAYGWSDRERRKPVERNSIWSIKSMSKPFTATAVLMLAEEGKLSLDDPVSRYIPRFAGDPRTTIRHLLSHTSGYREEVGDPSPIHESFTHWVEDWAAQTPAGTLGEFRYSDFGFAAAGYIVEAVSGLPIGRFTEERIIAPLRLHNTSTEFSSDSAWRARLNPWYRWNDHAGAYHLLWAAHRPAWQFYPAAWGMFSTAMDYARFMALWVNKGESRGVRLLAKPTVEEALREQARDGWGGYGYGWFVAEEPRANGLPSVFFHGGGDGTMAMVLPSSDAMVLLLTHSRSGPHLGALRALVGMLEIFEHPGFGWVYAAGEDLETLSLTAEERHRYLGAFAETEEAPSWLAHVQQEDGVLHLRITRPGGRAAATWSHLIPLGAGVFAPGRYEGSRVAAVHPHWRVRFTEAGVEATELRLVSRGDTLFAGRRVDADRVLTEAAARRSRVSVADILEQTLAREGIEAARQRFRSIHLETPDSVRITQAELRTLGYRLLREERHVDQAIAVLELVVEAFPSHANPYDILGDAYHAADRLEEARRSYARAVALAEPQGGTDLRIYRFKLERTTRQLEARK